ncbi:MAG: hypothetical protein KJZ70_03035, partial [Bryobacterales bacterium]|nr:hypothetical protein [Bryobacterales bacterium]
FGVGGVGGAPRPRVFVGAMRQQIQESLGFEIQAVRTEVGGFCPHCQALRRQRKESETPAEDDAE